MIDRRRFLGAFAAAGAALALGADLSPVAAPNAVNGRVFYLTTEMLQDAGFNLEAHIAREYGRLLQIMLDRELTVELDFALWGNPAAPKPRGTV